MFLFLWQDSGCSARTSLGSDLYSCVRGAFSSPGVSEHVPHSTFQQLDIWIDHSWHALKWRQWKIYSGQSQLFLKFQKCSKSLRHVKKASQHGRWDMVSITKGCCFTFLLGMVFILWPHRSSWLDPTQPLPCRKLEISPPVTSSACEMKTFMFDLVLKTFMFDLMLSWRKPLSLHHSSAILASGSWCCCFFSCLCFLLGTWQSFASLIPMAWDKRLTQLLACTWAFLWWVDDDSPSESCNCCFLL